MFAACAPVVVEGPPPPPPRAVVVAGVPPIHVRLASYGPNCGVPRGNASERVAQLCDGRSECVFRADNAQFGDPAVGCPKAFDVEFECAGQRRMSRTPPRAVRAGEEYRIELSCR
ncbi:MAG TPA: hypothetical protein VGM88_17310 [Kofleriaceae bacterium]